MQETEKFKWFFLHTTQKYNHIYSLIYSQYRYTNAVIPPSISGGGLHKAAYIISSQPVNPARQPVSQNMKTWTLQYINFYASVNPLNPL